MTNKSVKSTPKPLPQQVSDSQDSVVGSSTTTDVVSYHVNQDKRWKELLKPFQKVIDRNQAMYEFYRTEEMENVDDELSLNTPFAIVESMVSKANSATMTVTCKAHGENNLDQLENWVSSVLSEALEDGKVAKYKGSFRQIREMYARSFFVKGNVVAEVNWLNKTESIYHSFTVKFGHI